MSLDNDFPKPYPAYFLHDFTLESISFIEWLGGEMKIHLDIDNGVSGFNVS